MANSPERPTLAKQPALGRPCAFPNPVACFSSSILFTTLSPADARSHSKTPFCHPVTEQPCQLLCLDEYVRYIPFASDFGPLNLAHVWECMVIIHEEHHSRKSSDMAICIYTEPDPRDKVNMALIVALYMVVHHRQPWDAYKPLMDMEFVSFRDAGAHPADYGISLQDCLYGFDRAYHAKLFTLVAFDRRDYEYHEVVENGDLNVFGPFIPFASPKEHGWVKGNDEKKLVARDGSTPPDFEGGPSGPKSSLKSNHAFRCVMRKFKQENVGLVVRLNEQLYDRRHFTDAGMDHTEMYFDDGTNPSDEIIREFIRVSDDVIVQRKQRVAVHCRAGLGRTGVLIGAYLIYKHGFSANEVIAIMRIIRPGMVVGPQQHFMAANQAKWSGWAVEDRLRREGQLKKEASDPLLTPPSECGSLPPSGTSIESIVMAATPLRTISLINREPRSEPHSTPKAVISRPSTPSAPRVPPSRNRKDDAIGQPRKGIQGIRGEPYCNLGEPIAEDEELAEVSLAMEVAELPTRGVKRGSTRIPILKAVPSAASVFSPPVHAHLSPCPGTPLGRHASTASTASLVSELDDRLPKRRIPSATERSPGWTAKSASAPQTRTPSPARHRPELAPTFGETRLSTRQSMIPTRRVLPGLTRSAPGLDAMSPDRAKPYLTHQQHDELSARLERTPIHRQGGEVTPPRESKLLSLTPTRLGGLLPSWVRNGTVVPARQ